MESVVTSSQFETSMQTVTDAIDSLQKRVSATPCDA
jgi:hypothetical protein